MKVRPESIDKSSIPSLKYEVNLLKQRNRVLSQENGVLLDRVEELTHALQEANSRFQSQEQTVKMMQQTRNQERISLQELAGSVTKIVGNQKTSLIREMLINSCPTSSILSEVNHLLQGISQSQKQESHLAHLSTMLNRRREKLANRDNILREIVHVVKQPTWKEPQADSDLSFVFRTTQKLILKIKRADVSSFQVLAILDLMKQFVREQALLRLDEINLKEKERQMQLGMSYSQLAENASLAVTERFSSQLRKQEQINIKISAL